MARDPEIERMWQYIRAFRRWIDQLRFTGDGVQVKKTLHGCSVDIRWPPDAPPQMRDRIVVAKLVSGTTVDGLTCGQGKYPGTYWNFPTSAISVTSNISEADLGTSGKNCLLLNSQEIGYSTADLDASGTYLPLIFIGLIIGATAAGTPAVLVVAAQEKNCDGSSP